MNTEQLIKNSLKEIVEDGKIEAISTYFSKSYIAHVGNKEYSGHNFLKKWMKQLLSAIDGIAIDRVIVISADDTSIIWKRVLSGVHVKSLRGIPASQRKVSWIEMVYTKFHNEKITEEWVVSELAGELMSKQPKN